ncbi:MAG TPA: WD40 repeat domain-containing protein, partial [Aggregatilineales bacterium]|nr:WD40 repeat domain-containing protein [Aggregatilineales bacterium]
MYAYHHHIQLPTEFYDIVWSPDGELLALAGISGGVFIVTKTNRFVSMLQGYIGKAESLSWSPDGRKIVCADTMDTMGNEVRRYTDIIHTVQIWDVATGMVIQNLYSSPTIPIRWVK